MKKTLLSSLLIIPALFFISCDSNNETITKTGSKIITSNSNNSGDFSIFSLVDTDYSYNPFAFYGDNLFFSNLEDNNRLSYMTSNIPSPIIKTTDIEDFLDYPTSSLTILENILYFSNGSEKNSLYSMNLETKDISFLNNHNVHSLCSSTSNLFYINSDDNNKLYIYSPKNNTYITPTNDSIGKFIINGNNIIYQNLSDNSKLYKVNINGNNKEKLTDYSVDSFCSYEGNLLFINSSDNNNLYLLNPTDLSAKRIYLMNGQDLKQYNNKLYFINIDKSNALYSLNINQETQEVSSSEIIKDGINEYYLSDNFIFYEKKGNANNIYAYNIKE